MADQTDNEQTEEYTQKWWASKISKREAELDKEWRISADAVVNRYLDKRGTGSDTVSSLNNDVNARKYNIFWANTQITKAALYATPPKPEVKRQYGDQKDDVARTAALILQRILTFGLHKDTSDMHNAFMVAVEDRLIPGAGQVWCRLEVETEPYQIPAVLHPETMQELAPAQDAERIIHQEVPTEYVHWRDFLWESSRIWSDVGWVARRCWMRKVKFVTRFGKNKYSELKQAAKEAKDSKGKYPKGFLDGKVEVFEIWCKDTNKVYWMNPVADELLDEKDDPLQLDDFWPCPEPLLATHTTNDLMPRSDYTMVQDQYEELDILNMRISILTKALRVVGCYDKNNADLSKMLTGSEFSMIPVDNWAAFAEVGGLKGQVDWFPVETIAEVLGKLMEQRITVIGQIYELTSISDIMRGASNPRDTLGAQKLKAQYSSVRLQLNQQDIGKFVRQALRIKSEIICKHFEPQRIMQMSQIEFTESAMYAPDAIALLKNYEASEYRIDVAEETLSLADYNAEKETRTEYLTSVGQFLSQAGQITQGMPQSLPYLLKMIAWVTASFRGSADIESVLDEAIREASKPQQPAPNPEQQKAEAAAQQVHAETQAAQAQDQSRAQADIAVENVQAHNALKQTIADVVKDNIAHENKMEQQAHSAKHDSDAQDKATAHAVGTQAQKTHDAIVVINAKPEPKKGK